MTDKNFEAHVKQTKGCTIRNDNGRLQFEAKWRKSSTDKYQRRYNSYEPTIENLLKGVEWRERTIEALKLGTAVPAAGAADKCFSITEAYNQADNDKWSKNDSNWRTIATHHGWSAVQWFTKGNPERKIDTVTYSDIIEYRNDLDNRREGRVKNGVKEKLSKGTINKYLRCLESMLKVSVKHGRFSADATKQIPEIPFYKENKSANTRRCFEFDFDPETKEIIRDEEGEFYQWCVSYGEQYLELKKLVQLGMYTGIRIGAILKLKVSDINFRRGTISIRKEIDKTDLARVIKISPVVRDVLKYFVNNRVGKQPLIVSRIDAILNREKKVGSFQWNHSKVDRYFKKIKTRMGLEDDVDFTFHSTRHTAITRLLENGTPIHLVKAWAGHTNISTTENYITTNVSHVDQLSNRLLEHPASIVNSKQLETEAETTAPLLVGRG